MASGQRENRMFFRRGAPLWKLGISFLVVYSACSTLVIWHYHASFEDAASDEASSFLAGFKSTMTGRTDSSIPSELTEDPPELLQRMDGGAAAPVLTAYLEPIDQAEWEIVPLPVRQTTAASLTKVTYPNVSSCRNLPNTFPVDNYPEADPFLPWIHDVFPSHDGTHIQFVAQNRRRCNSGRKFAAIIKHLQPQSSLFQHVPIQRFTEGTETRYKITTHEAADPDGIETRFICRFKPSGQETLSEFNFNYHYAGYRKGYSKMFTEEGRDVHMVWTSQLLFKCPVPPDLIDLIKSGTSVVNDRASLFVDVIPIRTPPRYGDVSNFFPPHYAGYKRHKNTFFSQEMYKDHILPKVEDSGRWENIPICQPSWMTYHKNEVAIVENTEHVTSEETVSLLASDTEKPKKPHRLIACTWASSVFRTRGDRSEEHGGDRRLQEWLEYNLMTGFDHVYVYDNSHAVSGDGPTLEHVTNLFPPSKVTRIDWPSKICNNNKGNSDNKGERSSQYAAEASCRLRFGPHTEWLGNFDYDEYLVPLGDFNSMPQVLDGLEKEDMRIISFQSWRAWPRRSLIEPPVALPKPNECYGECFRLEVPSNLTFLQTFNCERQKGPKVNVMPAEKQIFRPDYVLHHFVHYSTVTQESVMTEKDHIKNKLPGNWRRQYKEKHARFSNELNEATMLHSKAVAIKDTLSWESNCKTFTRMCRLGTSFPRDLDEKSLNKTIRDEDGYVFNCYINEKIEDFWVPKLQYAMNARGQEIQ